MGDMVWRNLVEGASPSHGGLQGHACPLGNDLMQHSHIRSFWYAFGKNLKQHTIPGA